MKPRLLVVPHIYAEDIAIREIELAKRLTATLDVSVLKWRHALHVEGKSIFRRRIKQVGIAAGAALRRRSQSVVSDGLTSIQVPVWQPILFQKVMGRSAATKLCKLFNRRILRSVVANLRISHLLLANELFGVDRIVGVRSFFDVVDWFPEEEVSPSELRRIRDEVTAIGRAVDGVFAVSEPLCEKLAHECGIRALPLPNGADVKRLRHVPPEKVLALRKGLGIAENFAIGYIGNHGSFTGVDLAIKAFLAARERMPDARLIIIGPADIWRELLEANRSAGVLATGNVPPAEIANYFNAIDIGVLAQQKTTGTDFAFQIKVVEYSACRKFVVSTPLTTWQKLAWPNVILAEPNPQAWAEAFVAARMKSWNPAWDHIVDGYDWKVLAAGLAKVMLATDGVMN
jgi:glycosyltransferase involved in cell wall biosynthesis